MGQHRLRSVLRAASSDSTTLGSCAVVVQEGDEQPQNEVDAELLGVGSSVSTLCGELHHLDNTLNVVALSTGLQSRSHPWAVWIVNGRGEPVVGR